jgi:hypothetical protein
MKYLSIFTADEPFDFLEEKKQSKCANTILALHCFLYKKGLNSRKALVHELHFRGIRNGQCSTIMKYMVKGASDADVSRGQEAGRHEWIGAESKFGSVRSRNLAIRFKSGSESNHYSCCFCMYCCCCCPINMQGMGNQNQAISAQQCPAYASLKSQPYRLSFFLSPSDRTFVKFTFDLVA